MSGRATFPAVRVGSAAFGAAPCGLGVAHFASSLQLCTGPLPLSSRRSKVGSDRIKGWVRPPTLFSESRVPNPGSKHGK